MTTFFGEANRAPPRVTFTNLRTGETFEMPFVPETLEHEVIVNWARLQVIGQSHETLQYINTGNHRFESLEFAFQATTEDEARSIEDAKKFLLSLCYAPSGANGVREGAPPRVLFVWPQLVSMTCVVSGVRIRDEAFFSTGLAKSVRISVPLEEIRDVRLSSDEVRVYGVQRRSGIDPEAGDVVL